MDQDLLVRVRAAAAALFPGTNILVAYAHGSRVSGRPRAESDLDIGYFPLPGAAGPTLGEEMALAAKLTEALGLSVDLRNLSEAPLDLRGSVLEEGARVYAADESLRVDLEAGLLSRYHDYKEVYRRLHEERLAGLAARL
jgi:predicted nucleotidyltransferase